MRTLTAPEIAARAAAHRSSSRRVLIEDATGAFRDLTAIGGRNRVVGLDWGEGLDDATARATATLRREIYGSSLSTLADDSPLNLDGPLIDLGREFVIETATGVSGSAPGEPALRRVFAGEVDDVDVVSGPNVVLSSRDRGGVLLDTQIEDSKDYGSAEGIALHLVMQQLLDDTLGAGVVTLAVPVAPTFLVTTYTQEPASLLEALQALALLPGWAIRYRWSETAGDYQLTLYKPDREKAVADAVIPRSRYLRVNRLGLAKDPIRNRIRLEYVDKATKERKSVTVKDDASISKYGPRFMRLVEYDSPIDTEAEATAMATAALDLAAPPAELEVEMLYTWWVEIGDLLQFEAKPGAFDTDQTLAVVGIRHTWKAGQRRTVVSLRGKPAGAYAAWLRREVPLAGENALPPEDETKFKFLAVYSKEETDTSELIGMAAGDAVATVWVYDIARLLPVTTPPRPTSATRPAAVLSPLGDATFEYRALRPATGWKRWVYLVSRSASGRAGEMRVWPVLPKEIPGEGIQDGAVSEPKVADEAIARSKVRQRAIASLQLEIAGIERENLVTRIIDETLIAIAGISDPLLFAAGVVEEAAVALRSIGSSQLKLSGVARENVADDAINEAKLQIATLAGISPNAGNLLQGRFDNLAAATYLDLDATGASPVLSHPKFAIYANGAATFSGVLAAGTLLTGRLVVEGNLADRAVDRASAVVDGILTAAKLNVSTLSEIAPDAGVVVSGELRNLAGTRYIDLDAVGAQPFIAHEKFQLRADGTALFSGTLAAGTVLTGMLVVSGNLANGAVDRGLVIADDIITERMVVEHSLTAASLLISTLSELTPDVGIVVNGELRNLAGTRYIDLDAVGSQPFIAHEKFALYADGSAVFLGTLSGVDGDFSGTLAAADGTFNVITGGVLQNAASNPTAAIRLSSADTLPATAARFLDMGGPDGIRMSAVLTQDTGGDDGAGTKLLPKGVTAGTVRNNQSIVFADTFNSPPLVIFIGGATDEGRAKWATTPGGADAGSGVTPRPSGALILQSMTADVSTTGFTAHLRLLAKSSPGSRSANFGAPTTVSSLNSTTGSATPLSGDLPSSTGVYNAAFEVGANCATSLTDTTISIEVVAEYSANGGAWAEVASKWVTFVVTAGTTGSTISSIEIPKAGVDGGDSFRLVAKSFQVSGGHGFFDHLTVSTLTWYYDASALYASMTPNGDADAVRFVVIAAG